ncbi:MAG: T9SS type A sorting domain-containing protein [Flavobacteriales bacterium]|nr:T9SS type A sorting domain-containing protein [Flavobacteriales bacterium]
MRTVRCTLCVEAFPGLQANTVNGNEGQAFRDVLLDVLQADDTDGDITNGTPNAGAIVEAFALHGITLLSNATLVHSNPETAPEAQGIELDAQLILDLNFLPFLSQVKLFYRVNNGAVWNTLPMVDFGSNDYHVTIPPQSAGTVVAYYMGVEDSFQQLSAVVPIGAAEPDPNVPYYIMVDFGLVATDDADNNTQLGNWDIGLPTDNATTGEWEFNMPVGSYATPGDLSTVVQPGYQHTPGGEICYVTGNASTELAQLGENDVDGGTTTLRSAALDMSNMQEPAMSYWRWYVNDPPSGANPGADWWQVWLSNDGNNWVPVENTRTSDRSWRRVAFRVGDLVSPSSTVYIKYNASDSIRPGQNLDGGSLVEAAVDDIQLWDLADGIGIEETATVELLVFPKPAQDQLQVRGAMGDARSADLVVLDAAGRVVMRQQVGGAALRDRIVLNVADLAPGSYVLQVITDRARGEERFQVVR